MNTTTNNEDNTMNAPANHHYFASTALNWAVASTRAEAIAKVARDAGADTIKRQVASCGGLYVWVCRVEAPITQHYAISFFAPVGVRYNNAVEYNIVNAKGHVTPTDEKPTPPGHHRLTVRDDEATLLITALHEMGSRDECAEATQLAVEIETAVTRVPGPDPTL